MTVKQAKSDLRPGKIVSTALETLGLDSCFLRGLSGLEEHELRCRLSGENLSASEWVALCDALYLRVDCISYGYFYPEHKAQIRWALARGYFKLPRTAAFWRLRVEIWMDILREWRWQSRHCGFRLRWKARFQDFRSGSIRRLDQWRIPYDPQERARTAFRKHAQENDKVTPGRTDRLNFAQSQYTNA